MHVCVWHTGRGVNKAGLGGRVAELRFKLSSPGCCDASESAIVFEMFPTKALCMVWWCCCLLCFRHTFYCIACLVVAAQNLHMPVVKCSVGGYAHFVPCTGAPAIDHDQLHFHRS